MFIAIVLGLTIISLGVAIAHFMVFEYSKALICFLMAVFGAFIVVPSIKKDVDEGNKVQAAYEQECQAKGGVVYRTREDTHCVRKQFFLD